MSQNRAAARRAIAEFEQIMGELLQDAALLDELTEGLESHSPFSLDMLPPRVRRQFAAALMTGAHALPKPFDKTSFTIGLFLGCRIAGQVYEEEQA